jgi:predicted O-methyltransferase YrrM
MLKRWIKGDSRKRTRFHNFNGDWIDAAGILYLPRCVASTVAFKLTGQRPELPWIGYRAIRRFNALIKKDWKILEFGSGMSSIWFARRCGLLTSIEANETWFHSMESIFAKYQIQNVDYRFVENAPTREELNSYAEADFDLVLVDGDWRDQSMRLALTMVKPNGYVYLDNSDVPYQSHQEAKEILLKAAGSMERVKIYNDLCPTQISVCEGILARIEK